MNDWSSTWQRRHKKRKKLSQWGKLRELDKITLFKWLGLGAFLTTVAGVFILMLMFAWYAKDLPNPDKVVRRSGFSTKILDRNGQLLYDMYEDVNRVPVKLEDVPVYLREATIAVEDKDFYKHGGFDPKGILRATFNTVVRGKLQGGSTLTQQLVKNVLLSSERTLSRKFKELVLAIQIERKFNKDQILQMYLNEAPYGGTAWGVAAGAERYFGKKVKDLDLAESAMLAGLPQAPSYYSPYGAHPKAYLERAKTVLRRMREDGYITKEQEKQAIDELAKMKFKPRVQKIKAPHFVFYVKDQLVKLLGEKVVDQGGLVVTTTLDDSLQEYAQQVVSEEIKKIEKLHITNGAAMAIDAQTGEILAMVGSKDFFAKDYDGQFNAALALRQPGSSIKPVTYALAFKRGYTPATMLLDIPTEFGTGSNPYKPKNYDGKFRGPVQLRFALGSSLNIPAVKLVALVGVKDMLQLAYDMGFETLKPTEENLKRFGLSVTLGAGEVRLLDLVRAYAVFANGGERVEPVSILKVEREGKTIYQAPKPRRKRVLSPEVAFLINHVLYDNNARLLTFGPNSYLNMNGRPIAVKTGTTNDMRDNWTVGWSTKVVVGTWVGNNDDTPMKRVASGVTGASPIWRKIMLKAFEKYGGDQFKPPKDVVAKRVDVVTGYAEHDGFPARSEYFIKGTEPSKKDPIHKMLKLCKGQDKLATAIDIARNNYDEKEFFTFNDYQEPGAGKLWKDDIQAWLATVDDPRYHPPTEYCDSENDLMVQFEEPGDKARIDSNQVKVRIKVISPKDLKTLKLQVNGHTVEEFSSKEVETSLNLDKGSYELKAVAENVVGKQAEATIHIGVQQDWDFVVPEASGSGSE